MSEPQWLRTVWPQLEHATENATENALKAVVPSSETALWSCHLIGRIVVGL